MEFKDFAKQCLDKYEIKIFKSASNDLVKGLAEHRLLIANHHPQILPYFRCIGFGFFQAQVRILNNIEIVLHIVYCIWHTFLQTFYCPFLKFTASHELNIADCDYSLSITLYRQLQCRPKILRFQIRHQIFRQALYYRL